MKSYVYAHYVNNKPVYIGKGQGKRHTSKRSYDDHTSNILLNGLTETKAIELEAWLIKVIGLDNLRNVHSTGHLGRTSEDIYKIYKHTNVEKIFDRAEKGDLKAILFIANYIPGILKKALQNNNLTGINNKWK